jgi:hypothetical protein
VNWNARKGMLAGSLLWLAIVLREVWRGTWDGNIFRAAALIALCAAIGGLIAYQSSGKRW